MNPLTIGVAALAAVAVIAGAFLLASDHGSEGEGYLYAIYTDPETNLDIVDVYESHIDGGRATEMCQRYRTSGAPGGINAFWGFDGDTGKGPFGAFYAAVNLAEDCPAYDADDAAEKRRSASPGCVAYILDPDDLGRTLAGHAFDPSLYNVMLVVPTVYWASDRVVAERTEGNLVEGREYNVLYVSSDPSYTPAGHGRIDGMRAYAHSASTVSGKTDFDSNIYPYLGIGVYEGYATVEGDFAPGVLVSQSGRVPTAGPDVDGFKELVDALVPASGKGLQSAYQQRNYFQWTLCKIMDYAVMGSKNSQVMVGLGYTGENDSAAVTGSTDRIGFYGEAPSTVSASGQTSSEAGRVSSKLFIENSWGSVNEFVGDAYVAGDSADTMALYAGNFLGGEPLIESRNQPSAGQPWADIYKGGDPHRVISAASTGSTTWDTPTASNANAAAYSDPAFPGDIVNSSEGGTNSLTAGGRWDNNCYAGTAFICGAYAIDLANEYRGARIAYLMSEDALARYRKVIYAPEHGVNHEPRLRAYDLRGAVRALQGRDAQRGAVQDQAGSFQGHGRAPDPPQGRLREGAQQGPGVPHVRGGELPPQEGGHPGEGGHQPQVEEDLRHGPEGRDRRGELPGCDDRGGEGPLREAVLHPVRPCGDRRFPEGQAPVHGHPPGRGARARTLHG
jgi:hypothetical protein